MESRTDSEIVSWFYFLCRSYEFILCFLSVIP